MITVYQHITGGEHQNICRKLNVSEIKGAAHRNICVINLNLLIYKI